MISGRHAGHVIIDELWAAPDPPYHWNCRSTVRPQWGDGQPMTQDESDLINGRFRGNEIITSAADQRGLSARPVKGRTL